MKISKRGLEIFKKITKFMKLSNVKISSRLSIDAVLHLFCFFSLRIWRRTELFYTDTCTGLIESLRYPTYAATPILFWKPDAKV